MNKLFLTTKNYIGAHKLISAAILIATMIASYGIYSASTAGTAQAKYILANVERGTIVSSISGSGQVAVSRSIDIKSKASGDVTYVAVTDGQEVYAGQTLVVIDPTDAQKAVRDAENALAKARLDLQKLQGGETAVGIFRGAAEKATAELDKVYTDALGELSSAFFDFPGIIASVDSILLSDSISGSKIWNASFYADSIRSFNEISKIYKDNAITDLQAAKNSYNISAAEYKNISLTSDRAELDKIILTAHNTAKLLVAAIKDATDLIQLYRDALKSHDITPNVISETHLASLASYTSKASSHMSQLDSFGDSAQSQKEAVFNATISVTDQQIKVRQAEDALTDAKTTLANCYVRAPFAGVITKVNVKKYDTASGVVATLITKEKIAQLSLNEIDAVKIKVGQKATLTFDAIEEFSIAGTVADVDVSGTVSQGVVTYSMKIAFASDDVRIKPGMSVSAAIITDAKTDVLMVPISAVKNQGGSSVVSVIDNKIILTTANLQGILLPSPARQQAVETGSSNDSYIEITSGLNEGDQIVARTITVTAAKTAAANSNPFASIGASGRGGSTGAVRTTGGGGNATFIAR